MTDVELRKCPDCGVSPGERHQDGCDVAMCRTTGWQHLQCEGELHEYNGRAYGEHEGPCGPSVWSGEWPGDKFCRENNLYTPKDSIFKGAADLNELASRHARGLVRWDTDLEDYVLVK